MIKDLRRFLFLKLKLVTVSQFIVSHCYLNKEFAVIFHRCLNKVYCSHGISRLESHIYRIDLWFYVRQIKVDTRVLFFN